MSFQKLRTKIMFGFLVVILLSISFGLYNHFTFKKINQKTDFIVSEQLPLLLADEQLRFNIAQRTALIRGYILYGEESYLYAFDQYSEQSRQRAADILEIANHDERIQTLIVQNAEYERVIREEVLPAYQTGRTEQAVTDLQQKVEPLAQELIIGLEEVSANRETTIVKASAALAEESASAVSIGSSVAAIVVLLGIATALFTARMITNPLNNVMERMKLMAGGDLTKEPLISTSKDEIGQLILTTNQMNENTRELLEEINEVASSVCGQSEALTQAASEVTEESSQIASAMEELSAYLKQQVNTTAAQDASLLSLTDKVSQKDSKDGCHSSPDNMLKKSLAEIAAASDGTDTYREGASLALQQSNQSMEDVVSNSQELARLSASLNKLVGKFKV